jgi:hypothetical protein
MVTYEAPWLATAPPQPTPAAVEPPAPPEDVTHEPEQVPSAPSSPPSPDRRPSSFSDADYAGVNIDLLEHNPILLQPDSPASTPVSPASKAKGKKAWKNIKASPLVGAASPKDESLKDMELGEKGDRERSNSGTDEERAEAEKEYLEKLAEYRLPDAVRFRRGANLEAYLATRPEDGDEHAIFRWNLARFVESVPSRIFIMLMIATNAVMVGCIANGDFSDDTYAYIDWVFTIFFCVELFIKLYRSSPRLSLPLSPCPCSPPPHLGLCVCAVTGNSSLKTTGTYLTSS